MNGNAFSDKADIFIGCLKLFHRRFLLIIICLCLLLAIFTPALMNINALNIACVTRWVRATVGRPIPMAIVIIPNCLMVE